MRNLYVLDNAIWNPPLPGLKKGRTSLLPHVVSYHARTQIDDLTLGSIMKRIWVPLRFSRQNQTATSQKSFTQPDKRWELRLGGFQLENHGKPTLKWTRKWSSLWRYIRNHHIKPTDAGQSMTRLHETERKFSDQSIVSNFMISFTWFSLRNG